LCQFVGSVFTALAIPEKAVK